VSVLQSLWKGGTQRAGDLNEKALQLQHEVAKCNTTVAVCNPGAALIASPLRLSRRYRASGAAFGRTGPAGMELAHPTRRTSSQQEQSAMRIGIPVHQGRISPLFDTARTLLVVDLQEGREVSRKEHELGESGPAERVARLTQYGVQVLLCGALSRPLWFMVSAAGVKVLPFLTGEVDSVLEAYLRGNLEQPAFFLPGCCPGRWGRGRRRRRRGPGPGGGWPFGPPFGGPPHG